MSYQHWIRGRRRNALVDFNAMSYEALVAVMNALNPSPNDFACEGDRKAGLEASVQVAQRWSATRGPSVGLS